VPLVVLLLLDLPTHHTRVLLLLLQGVVAAQGP
jgi:hypothetical protein